MAASTWAAPRGRCIKDISFVLQGRRPEGGSTITQQVAKNILLNNDVSVGRKLKEAILATRLEHALPKTRILELYLNEIWLGYRSYGVGAAAYNYFGKSISDLTLAQCAYLAALPKGPDNYQPVKQKAAAVRRRNMILDDMARLGLVPAGGGRQGQARRTSRSRSAVQSQISRRRLFRRRDPPRGGENQFGRGRCRPGRLLHAHHAGCAPADRGAHRPDGRPGNL